MTSILALFGRGESGLSPAAPLEFASLVLPRSPNTCLAVPAWHPGFRHLDTPLYAVSPETLMAALLQMAAGFPRTTLMAHWGERHQAHWRERQQAQWVERSPLMNYPDIIVAECKAAPAGGTGLFLYSRSLFGWSDLEVNRARVDRWLQAISVAA